MTTNQSLGLLSHHICDLTGFLAGHPALQVGVETQTNLRGNFVIVVFAIDVVVDVVVVVVIVVIVVVVIIYILSGLSIVASNLNSPKMHAQLFGRSRLFLILAFVDG